MPAVDALFDAVYDDPDSDDKRLALAAALQADGDPRGELISLQLERARIEEGGGTIDEARTKREAALIKKHGSAWLGPVAPVTAASSRVFEKGFLVAATFSSKKAADEVAAIGAREWSTIRVLARSGFRGAPPALLAHPVMRSLVTIGVPLTSVRAIRDAPQGLVRLAIPSPASTNPARMTPMVTFDVLSPLEAAPIFEGPPVRSLVALRLYREKNEVLTSSTVTAIANARAVPSLRYLRIALTDGPAAYRWLFGSPLMRQLETLVLDLNDYASGPQGWFGQWYAELLAMGDARDTRDALRFALWGWSLRLSRDAAGRPSVLDAEADDDPSYRPSESSLSMLVAELPRGAVRVLRVAGVERALPLP